MMNKPRISYGHGSVENAQVARVIAHVGEGADALPALAHWDGGTGKWGLFPMKWIPARVATLTTPAPCVYALAPDGRVGLGHGNYREETIDDSPTGTRARGPMRDIRVIADEVYATGMGRQVYRRERSGPWVRIDDGVVAPLGEIAVSGFSSIHGSAADDLWAVGMMGEIWHFGPQGWTQHDSPTNLLLHRVVVVSAREAYATGQKGLVLRFDGAGWQAAARNDAIGNLWGAEWFAGELYVSSERGIFRLRDGALDPVAVPTATSFGHLDAKDGVMWSFGTGHLTYTNDGQQWVAVKPLV
jgi:hypothetical protein